MKLFLLFSILFNTLFITSQTFKLKKKDLKTYMGQIPAYDVNLNNQIIHIEAASIEVKLTKDSLYVNVGSLQWEGTYNVSKIEKKKFELIGKMNETGIPETLLLDSKKKTLTRRGLFPQPTTVLEVKKKN
jgi:hypothetical protein